MPDSIFNYFDESSVDSTPTGNVKASPSVNSPNDGSFNSEENLKWANKKLTQKPFIVGDTPEEVRKQLSIVRNDGDVLQMSGGKISSGGFLFNINDTANISYDKELTDFKIPLNIQNMVRFIETLTNTIGYNNDTPLSTNLNDSLFNEYKINTDNISYCQKNWLNAAVNDLIVGYVKETYNDEVKAELSLGFMPWAQGYGVYFEDTLIKNIIQGEVSNIDVIKNYGFFGEPFVTTHLESGQSVIDSVYYPLKLTKKYVLVDGEYQNQYFLSYIDIFSMWHYIDTPTTESRTYPSTDSIYVDMTNNAPLSGFNNAILTTYPKNIYDYTALYFDPDNQVPYLRYTKDGANDSIDLDPTALDNIKTDISGSVTLQKPFGLFEDIFDVYSVSDLIQLIPSADTEINRIESNISYFCMKDSLITDNCLKVMIEEEATDIPVAFMTSDGRLCPNGFMHTDSDGNQTTKNEYPVEGYLHFVKRMYLKYFIRDENVTEDKINAITLADLVHWTSGDYIFEDFYAIIFKYISVYMQICYSSLLDNVLDADYNQSLDPTRPTQIKFNGCGKALKNAYPGLTDDGFYVTKTYSHDVYTRTGSTSSQETDIFYHKDDSSDYSRIYNRVAALNPYSKDLVSQSLVTNGMDYKWVESPEKVRDFDGIGEKDIQIVGCEDPINYIRRCSANGVTEENYDKLFIASRPNYPVKVHKIVFDGSNFSLTSCDVIINRPNKFAYFAGVVTVITLDDYLMPIFVPSEDWYTFENNSVCNTMDIKDFDIWLGTKLQHSDNLTEDVNSIINGMNFCWNSYAWRISIPFIVEPQYDGLGYLRGVSIEDTKQYKGLKYYYKLNSQLNKKDFVLFNLIFSNTLTNTNFDKECCIVIDSVGFKDTDENREAYIHSSKIFDYDYSNTTNDNTSDDGSSLKLVGMQSIIFGCYSFEETKLLSKYFSIYDKSVNTASNSFRAYLLTLMAGGGSIGVNASINAPLSYKIFPDYTITETYFDLGNENVSYTTEDNIMYLSGDMPHLYVLPSSVLIVDDNNEEYIDTGTFEILFKRSSDRHSNIVDSNGDIVGTIYYGSDITNSPFLEKKIQWSITPPTIQSITYNLAFVTKRSTISKIDVSSFQQSIRTTTASLGSSDVPQQAEFQMVWDGYESPVASVSDISSLPTPPPEGDGAVYEVQMIDGYANYGESHNFYKYSAQTQTWNLNKHPQDVYMTLYATGINMKDIKSYYTQEYL